ncbi:SRPBCC domain-containing protein [Sphingobium rhizovicinum]|uniref:SRPBCC domain-containing protein n=1 Tax=Sphingobium rhizovicinum TaxID=432308 RepID=A0ABV7NLX9_9SPHN
MPDCIIKSIDIAAPVATVWDAIIDHEKFGAWFLVALDQPFTVGEATTGHMTYPGYEHFPWVSRTVAIEPMTRFAFEWPATAGMKRRSATACRNGHWWSSCWSRSPPAPPDVTESGFDKVPEPRRSNVLRDNEGGWAEQVDNVRRYAER